MEAADWKCELCRNDRRTLHVHHLEYFFDRSPWEYGDEHLIAVCQICHSMIHESNLSMYLVNILRRQFRAGELYALKMLGLYGEGSDERLKYLQSVVKALADRKAV